MNIHDSQDLMTPSFLLSPSSSSCVCMCDCILYVRIYVRSGRKTCHSPSTLTISLVFSLSLFLLSSEMLVFLPFLATVHTQCTFSTLKFSLLHTLTLTYSDSPRLGSLWIYRGLFPFSKHAVSEYLKNLLKSLLFISSPSSSFLSYKSTKVQERRKTSTHFYTLSVSFPFLSFHQF